MEHATPRDHKGDYGIDGSFHTIAARGQRASGAIAPREGWQRGERRVRIEQWEKRYGQLLEYIRRHGDARVPSSHISEDGDRLGAWVVEQRDRFKRGMLEPDRSRRLEQLRGWTWGPRATRPQ
jgi:hypothetical protein